MNSINIIQLIDNIQNSRRPKVYKKRLDPFEISDDQFKSRYRLQKQTVKKIVEMVKDDIKVNKRGRGTSPELQVLVALRCWGRREVQEDAGDLHGLSQPTVSRICAKVSRAIAKHARRYIKMPSSLTDEQELMKRFYKIGNLPGIIGAIDGTHIRIKKTGGELAQYYINRKNYYSLNVQAVCDAKLKITDIVARWRGSTHDCRIFNESRIKDRFENGEFRGRLLGDSGYKLLPYLFTPILNPKNEKEQKYNTAHIRTRNVVERLFGVWKQRFRCLLDGMTIHLENVKPLIVALAVLHNIAIDENDEPPADTDEPILERKITAGINDSNIQIGGIQERRAKLILNDYIEKHF